MKNKDVLQPTGHLEIWKVYPDGEEELYYDEDNTITSGMGVGLGMLYAGSGSTNVLDFQVRYFQLGVGSDATKLATYGTSESALVSALGQANPAAPGGDASHGSTSGADYSSVESTVLIDFHEMMASDGQAFANSEGTVINTAWVFGVIPDNSIKRVDTNSVTYIIYLDQHACNVAAPINEIGLFMQNPLGLASYERSQLVAYRPFTDITKTSDFSLVFKWTLNF